jgi:YfiH family protein
MNISQRPGSRQEQAHSPVLNWDVLAGHGVLVALTTRHGGTPGGGPPGLNLSFGGGADQAATLANRETVAAVIGRPLAGFVVGQQVHGDRSALVGPVDAGRGAHTAETAVAGTDALITTSPAVTLCTLAADCVPIVLFDPRRRVLATVHSGWAGTVADIVGKTVARMIELGSQGGDILAGVGPSISPDRYQVDARVADRFAAEFPDWAPDLLKADSPAHWRLDLWETNRRLLLRSGLASDNIEVLGQDTGPGTPFFSHRTEAPCGRFGLVSAILEGN